MEMKKYFSAYPFLSDTFLLKKYHIYDTFFPRSFGITYMIFIMVFWYQLDDTFFIVSIYMGDVDNHL